MIEEILKYNKLFVNNKEYLKYSSDKYPEKKLAIVSCMDTRLTELLPAALGIKNGDAKIIKNAGGVISHHFGSVMRSLIIGIYDLGIEEILVIGHTDCGAKSTSSKNIIDKAIENGITQKELNLIECCGVDLDKWICGFNDLEESVKQSVHIIKTHILVPDSIKVHGLIIDSKTGKLHQVT